MALLKYLSLFNYMIPFAIACVWSVRDRKNRFTFKEKMHIITCLFQYITFLLSVQEHARRYMIEDLKRTEENVAALLAGCKEFNTVSSDRTLTELAREKLE